MYGKILLAESRSRGQLATGYFAPKFWLEFTTALTTGEH